MLYNFLIKSQLIVIPPMLGQTGRLYEAEVERNSLFPAGVSFQNCTLAKSFSLKSKTLLWKRLWTCFIRFSLPLPLPEPLGVGGGQGLSCIFIEFPERKPNKSVDAL